ncbi:MAG: Cys-tRNA(Pro) deacylase [Novosphingobium sp.]|nr:Cys-tRNA(Pro) deacylase [Novosphingobium sp.]
MSKSTPATKALEASGAAFTVHTYDYDPAAERIGLHAAEALGEDPARMLKTLMVLLDGKPACAVIPADKEVAMKKLAAALGGKHAEMMKPAEAERVTGYKVGGISAFGQRRKVPIAIEAAALDQPYVYINGGQRGLQVRLDPQEARRALGAVVAAIVG